VGLPFEVALVLGFSVSIAAHFALQRHFVWVHNGEFALSLRTQTARYLTLAVAQYAITAASTAVLPGVLHLDTEVVYLATFAVITPTTFVLFRHRVFHPET
jgi:putative flippase GtrA